MSNRSLPPLVRALALALAYFVAGRLGLMLPSYGAHITLVWLPTGIAVAALLRWGFGGWPGVALGALAVNLADGVAWPVALGIAAGNTAGPVLAAWLLRRTGFHAALDRERDILLLAGAAALGMLVPATAGVALLAAAGALPGGPLAAWLIWWAGDATGVIAAAPLLLVCTRAEWRALVARRAELLIWFGLTALLAGVVFVWNRELSGQPWAVAFLPLPMVAWAALRFGAIGTSLAVILLAFGAAYGTATGRGPFFRMDPLEGVLMLWLYMATGAVLGWLITALHAGRVKATAFQRLLEQALSDVSLGVLLAGRDRRITYASAGFTRLTGYAEAELLGRSCHVLQGAETAPAMVEKMRAALRGDGLFDGEILNYRKDGRPFWNGLLISPVHDEDGAVTGFLGIQRDITRRKVAEMRSASERAVLELLAAGAPLAAVLDCLARSYEEIFPGILCSILLLDEDGIHLRHGAAPSLPAEYCQAVDGIAIGPVAGSCGTAAFTRKITLVADIATDPLWQDFRELALGHGLRACWSVPVISSRDRVLGTFAIYYRAPQTARPEEVAALERGAHFAALAIERQRLLQAVRESEAALQAAQERAHLGSWELDLATQRGWWSRELHRLFQHDPAAGAPDFPAFLEMLHPDDRPKIADTHARLGASGQPQSVEFRSDPARGPVRYFSAIIEALASAPGRPPKIAGTVQDITEAREAQMERAQFDRKMQETQKLESLGVLAGGIAHDFNNLLTGIIGNASLASMDLPAGSPLQAYIADINHAAMRAADLCKQMLAYSGRGRFVVQRLDLGTLVEETAQMLQISISKKAVLRFHLEKNLPPVEVDATQLRQVIMNLVINASEAIGDRSGVIALTTGLTRVDRAYLGGTMLAPELAEGEYVFLEISDNGSGMSAETQARIFDPFFTTKFTGRGLGLAAVLGIVRGHKGALKVYSEPARGTTFKLLFPAATGLGDAVPESPPAPARWRGRGLVLVVDDEETIRSTVARMLVSTGFEPVLVADGREAVEVFRTDPGRFALVLLDLTMPHMDGEQTFAELRRLRADVRVVLMSGFNQQEALVRFPGKGLASFLQKPFPVGALRAVLQSVLG